MASLTFNLMADDATDANNPLAGITWPSERTLFKFFVVWQDDDPGICCPDAEAYQQAINAHHSVLICLACKKRRTVATEIVEIVI